MSQEVNRVEENQMFEIIDDEDHSAQAIIKVVGIGGGGGNAINYMIEKGLTGAEFIAMNTDAQALRSSKADIRLQLGSNITNGLGAGANPEIGYKSALEDKERIREIVTGADVVFIAAGMGGGTGTGACPVVAEIAKEEGALTIGVVSKPSMFEGRKRMNYATQGIARLSENIDSLLIIPNDKLQKSLPRGISFLDALSAANGVLYDAVSGFSSIINNEESTINIDFADVRTVMKGNARKVHRLYNDQVIAGFAGGTADAFTLLERFEAKLQAHQGNLERAAVELAKDWRTDRMLRKLEALLAVADKKHSYIITGNGDVVRPENDLIAIGSGGNFAQSAAMALLDNTELSAQEIVEKSLTIAGNICVFTNSNQTIERIDIDAELATTK